MNKRILITGATGLIGKALVPALENLGYTVFSLARKKTGKPSEITWDFDIDALEGFDSVIHLAGENIAQGRWTQKRKDMLISSRVALTKKLAESLTKLKTPPKNFLCASATGYYSPLNSAQVDESSPKGSGFLAQLCYDWEQASLLARPCGARILSLRISVVLSPEGGALQKMIPPFQYGLGAILGSGQQYMSWIALSDLIRAILFCLEHPNLSGPVNLCSPHPVTNEDFSRTLAKKLNRPCFFRAPASILKLMFGELAEEMLLAGVRAYPKKLLEAGFEFEKARLEQALIQA